MKKFIQLLLLVICSLSVLPTQAQKLPKGIKNLHFFARPIYSEGARLDVTNMDGTVTSENATQPSYQYFLYVEADTKKLKMTSLTIGGVKYKFLLEAVTSPVSIDNQLNGPTVLVKKTNCCVYQFANLNNGGQQSAPNTNHNVVIRGTINGKGFTVSATPKILDPVAAQ